MGHKVTHNNLIKPAQGKSTLADASSSRPQTTVRAPPNPPVCAYTK